MDRLTRLQTYAASGYGQKLCRRVTEAEFDDIVAFIEDNTNLDSTAFKAAASKLYIDGHKPKHALIITEILNAIA